MWENNIYLALQGGIASLMFLGTVLSFSRSGPGIWQSARMALGCSFAVALLLTVWNVSTQSPSFSTVISIMLMLVSFVGYIVVRFSQQYLQGERGQSRFAGLLMLVFCAVTFVIISNHMVVMLAAWVIVSLALHKLLMFYPQRPRAALAAHKKFIFARMAELSLLAAFILLFNVHNTWSISELLSHYSANYVLSSQEHIAAVLIALTALIKCAQLPVHGWLIQVVEAPTPVSAALHGGVINMGGFLLLSFAPLLALSSAAKWLLLIVAGISMVIAALIMTTRISVKVRLAWSTSAQMGMMLVECALGLYELALLHLVAHSLYKAHAFLTAGDAVNNYADQAAAINKMPSVFQWFQAFVLSTLLVSGLVVVANYFELLLSTAISPWLLLALAFTVLIAERHSQFDSVPLHLVVFKALLLGGTYLTLKLLISYHVIAPSFSISLWADIWISALFILLFGGYLIQKYALHQAWVRRINLYLYAGLYLDEWATRITLKLWPVRLPKRMFAKRKQSVSQESWS